jgi:hypothetical protein
MTCAPTATRTRDLPLIRKLVIRADLFVVLLQLNVSGFRLVLARGWHAPVLSRCLEQALPGSALGNPPGLR